MIVEQVKGKNSDVDMIRSDEEDRKKSSWDQGKVSGWFWKKFMVLENFTKKIFEKTKMRFDIFSVI